MGSGTETSNAADQGIASSFRYKDLKMKADDPQGSHSDDSAADAAAGDEKGFFNPLYNQTNTKSIYTISSTNVVPKSISHENPLYDMMVDISHEASKDATSTTAEIPDCPQHQPLAVTNLPPGLDFLQKNANEMDQRTTANEHLLKEDITEIPDLSLHQPSNSLPLELNSCLDFLQKNADEMEQKTTGNDLEQCSSTAEKESADFLERNAAEMEEKTTKDNDDETTEQVVEESPEVEQDMEVPLVDI